MKEHSLLLQAVGTALEELRKERKLTKTALSDFSNLQDCYVRGIIQGKRNPTVATIYALCETLQITPAAFFHRVDQIREQLESAPQN